WAGLEKIELHACLVLLAVRGLGDRRVLLRERREDEKISVTAAGATVEHLHLGPIRTRVGRYG
ncbi:MAG: hypothetical protein ACPHQP_09955, partial [Longimicrobiales bacterium]